MNGGLKANFIADPEELRKLTTFFAWTAWASVANRPGTGHSYTNNFPYDPAAGNLPTSAAVLWSALSLVALLGGIGIVLLAFGKFDYLGWADVMNLFPNGVRQLLDAVENGYWHARSAAFMGDELTRLIEWLRTPADLIFIVFGVIPLVIAAFKVWRSVTAVPLREPVSVR